MKSNGGKWRTATVVIWKLGLGRNLCKKQLRNIWAQIEEKIRNIVIEPA